MDEYRSAPEGREPPILVSVEVLLAIGRACATMQERARTYVWPSLIIQAHVQVDAITIVCSLPENNLTMLGDCDWHQLSVFEGDVAKVKAEEVITKLLEAMTETAKQYGFEFGAMPPVN